MDPEQLLDEMSDTGAALLAAMTAERMKAGRLVLAVTVLLILSAGTLTLANMVHQRVAEEATALREAISDEQGRAAAKARHPAGRGRAGSTGSRAPGGKAGKQGPVIMDGLAAAAALGLDEGG